MERLWWPADLGDGWTPGRPALAVTSESAGSDGWRISFCSVSGGQVATLGGAWTGMNKDDGHVTLPPDQFARFFDGDVAEIVIRYKGEFDAALRKALTERWRAKYGFL